MTYKILTNSIFYLMLQEFFSLLLWQMILYMSLYTQPYIHLCAFPSLWLAFLHCYLGLMLPLLEFRQGLWWSWPVEHSGIHVIYVTSKARSQRDSFCLALPLWHSALEPNHMLWGSADHTKRLMRKFWPRPQLVFQLTATTNHQTNEWTSCRCFQPLVLESSNWDSQTARRRDKAPLYALSEFLIHVTHEHHRRLSFTTKCRIICSATTVTTETLGSMLVRTDLLWLWPQNALHLRGTTQPRWVGQCINEITCQWISHVALRCSPPTVLRSCGF